MKRLTLLFVFVLSITSSALAQGTSGITLDRLNVRSTPAIHRNVIAQLPINTPVTIQGRSADFAWLFINANGQSGWVSPRYVSWDGVLYSDLPVVDNTIVEPSTIPEVSFDGYSMPIAARALMNIRSAPGTSNPVIGVLRANQKAIAIGRNVDGSWLVIDTGSLRGWVAVSVIAYDGDVNNLSVQQTIPDGTIDVPATTDPVPSSPPVANTGRYVITGPAPNNSTSYDVEITFHWNTTANLDLRVTGPDGYTIVPGAPPSPTGGYFQQAIGANEDCTIAEAAPLEVITWDKGTAPSGRYHIEAEHVNSCYPEQEEATLFWVSVKNDGPEVEFWVFFIKPDELFEFDFVRP